MGPALRERRPNSLIIESVQWFALQVKTRQEQAVAASLQRRCIESLVPVLKERRRWSDRLKTVQSPIFPGYVFCRLEQFGRLAALKTPGAIRLVRFAGRACPLQANEVESLLALAATGVLAQPCGYLPIGRRVRLVDGPLAGLTGVLTRSDKANRNPERITSFALNRGIRAAGGEVIVRMDIHTTYADDYIAACLAALDETGADNVGGPWVAQLAGGRVSEAVALAFACRWVTGGGKAHDPAHEGPVDTVYLGCWRREAFQRFGYFDETLVRAQDSEFNFRILLLGGKIWQTPRICSWYQPRKSVTQLFRQYGQYGYWKTATLKKHGQPASLRQLVPGAFLLALFALLAVGLFAPALLWALLFLLGTYLSAGIFSAAALCRRQARWDLFPYLPPSSPPTTSDSAAATCAASSTS